MTRLKGWREMHGLTLQELSDLTGYSVSMLSRVERDQRRLSALARVRLARALGVRVGEIFTVRDDAATEAHS